MYPLDGCFLHRWRLLRSAPTECGSLRLATTKLTTRITENRKYTRTPRENAQDVSVENPNVGKTTAVHRLQTITMMKYTTMMKLRGNDLELTTFATGGGNTMEEATTSLSHSLSLTRLLSLFTLATTRVAENTK